ncbi:TadE/TadG family type IV pilus assembly protein [Marinobacterium weihaiense]|uniref:Pilus assembly protein n=1 Tax=Marinobacterium weihaiense TaxID=2851016 RepID=A0ABS6MB73_9GAMM|nr:TadE/TadG family type IV pilus assembly protein [Marinobacterium weihaiense]MBV0933490.1 pilus assembly protein [Marinobacterium weihaiense]
MNIGTAKWRKSQQGLAAVEMTLVLPLLLFLFLATAEIGRMLYQYNTLTKAQRDGVRLIAASLKYNQQAGLSECGETGGTLPNNLMTRAANLVVYGTEGVSADAEPLLPGLTTADVGFCRVTGTQEVQIQVQYAFTPMLFDELPSFGLGDPVSINFPLTSAINMKVLAGG